MKKIFVLAAGFTAAYSFGQCTISGNAIIKQNENPEFTIDSKAQCYECYSWQSSNDDILKINGNNNTNKISAKAMLPGKSTIAVSFLTSRGAVQCEKIVEIIGHDEKAPKNCDLEVSDFKDVMVTESEISFFPNENSGNYNYNWTVSYVNGDVQESTEKIPQFFFSEINYIILVTLRIESKNPVCSVTLTRSFEQSYWKSKGGNVGKIEQKTYSPGSYSDYVKSDKPNDSK